MLIGLAALPLAAQVTIPQGSKINSAVFTIKVTHHSTMETVTLYRMTRMGRTRRELEQFWQSWSDVVGSFTNDTFGMGEVNLTALVQAWVNGDYRTTAS